MTIVFSGLENQLSKDIGEVTVFPEILFEFFNILFLALKHIIFGFIIERNLALDRADQN